MSASCAIFSPRSVMSCSLPSPSPTSANIYTTSIVPNTTYLLGTGGGEHFLVGAHTSEDTYMVEFSSFLCHAATQKSPPKKFLHRSKKKKFELSQICGELLTPNSSLFAPLFLHGVLCSTGRLRVHVPRHHTAVSATRQNLLVVRRESAVGYCATVPDTSADGLE